MAFLFFAKKLVCDILEFKYNENEMERIDQFRLH